MWKWLAEKIGVAKKPPRSFRTCPDCGQAILHTFDGDKHIIDRGHGQITKCGGLFESVIFKCGTCGRDIEVTRKELEEV